MRLTQNQSGLYIPDRHISPAQCCPRCWRPVPWRTDRPLRSRRPLAPRRPQPLLRDPRRQPVKNMAEGDVLLDPDGNVILDADGNVILDDGAGNVCCCNPPTTTLGGCCPVMPDSLLVSISGGQYIQDVCPCSPNRGGFYGSVYNSSGILSNTYCLMPNANTAATCEWRLVTSGPVVQVYDLDYSSIPNRCVNRGFKKSDGTITILATAAYDPSSGKFFGDVRIYTQVAGAAAAFFAYCTFSNPANQFVQSDCDFSGTLTGDLDGAGCDIWDFEHFVQVNATVTLTTQFGSIC